MSDKYDQAIDWLVEHADDTPTSGDDCMIDEAWSDPLEHVAGCLFQFCNPTGGNDEELPGGEMCGCLTMIRGGCGSAWTPELTREIEADLRLPDGLGEFSLLRGDELRAALQPFAEWQRRLDREIRTPAPEPSNE